MSKTLESVVIITSSPVEAHSNYIFGQKFCRTVIILKHTVETLREKKGDKDLIFRFM